MTFKCLFLSSIWVTLWLGRCSFGMNVPDHRAVERDNIGTYELIDIEFDDKNLILSFDAFGNQYNLGLQRNDKLIPKNIRIKTGIVEESLGYFTQLTESCHYHIKTDSNSSGHDYNQVISGGGVSICDKRGVRGKIDIKDDTLMIRPAKYLLDLQYDSSSDEV